LDTDVGIPLWMAPLVVQEMPEDPPDERAFQRFGAVQIDAAGRAAVGTDQLTVYLVPTQVPIGTQQYEQLSYLWFYPPASPGQPLRYRGFRMTLGHRGYAAIWEILSSEAEGREVYVSQPLEKAAGAKFGAPLPGRSFAVEPPVDEHPEVVVPRIVGDGPQPMGPFVYLDADALRVATLICRCEPSQVDEFPVSTHYRLRREENFAALHAGRRPPRNLPLPPKPVDLRHVLRLPDEL
jgi:hypothetical protein